MLRIEVNGKSYSFESAPVTIGRSPNCDVVVIGDGVSRQHVSVHQRDDGWSIDDESSYGVFSGDRKLGATVGVGESLTISLGSASGPTVRFVVEAVDPPVKEASDREPGDKEVDSGGAGVSKGEYRGQGLVDAGVHNHEDADSPGSAQRQTGSVDGQRETQDSLPVTRFWLTASKMRRVGWALVLSLPAVFLSYYANLWELAGRRGGVRFDNIDTWVFVPGDPGQSGLSGILFWTLLGLALGLVNRYVLMTPVRRKLRDWRLSARGLWNAIDDTIHGPRSVGPTLGFILLSVLVIFSGDTLGFALLASGSALLVAGRGDLVQYGRIRVLNSVGEQTQSMLRGAGHAIVWALVAYGGIAQESDFLLIRAFEMVGVLLAIGLGIWAALCAGRFIPRSFWAKLAGSRSAVVLALSVCIVLVGGIQDSYADDGGWQECNVDGALNLDWVKQMRDFLGQCPGANEPVMAAGPGVVIVVGILILVQLVNTLTPPPPMGPPKPPDGDNSPRVEPRDPREPLLPGDDGVDDPYSGPDPPGDDPNEIPEPPIDNEKEERVKPWLKKRKRLTKEQIRKYNEKLRKWKRKRQRRARRRNRRR